MATPSKAGFDTRYPEFSESDPTLVEARLTDAISEMDSAVWDAHFERGAYALTAHFLTVDAILDSTYSVTSGPISSRSVGDVSVSYASGTSYSVSESDYTSTKYGREYRRLMRLVSCGPMVI